MGKGRTSDIRGSRQQIARSAWRSDSCRGADSNIRPSALLSSSAPVHTDVLEVAMFPIIEAESIAPDVRRIVVEAPRIAKKARTGVGAE